MNRLKKCFPVLSAITVALLTACGGGGGGGGSSGAYSCAYIPGNVSSQSVSSFCTSSCSSGNAGAVADTNQASFAFVQAGTGERTLTITDTYSGPSFPVGSKVGALMTLLGSATIEAVTFNTYLGSVPQESAAGASLTAESTNGTTPAEMYFSFPATLEFNSLEIVINATNDTEYRIYEFCGDS